MKTDFETYKEQLEIKMTTLRNNFLKDLRNAGVELSDDAICRISENYVEISISKIDKPTEAAFGSSIELYAKQDNILSKRENQISVSSSGNFDPSCRESYYKHIHTASILKNWKIVCDIVNDYCKTFSEYMNN